MKKLFLVDVSSLFFRAFYAIPPMNNKEGLPTNALYGFLSMSLKLLNEKQPDYMAFCFDRKEPSFRIDLYPEYKANRGEMPEDLGLQIPYIKKLTDALGILRLDKEGFEADDIIGTLCQLANKDLNVSIISGDKDFAQLIHSRVKMVDTMKNKSYDEKGVKEKWGVLPSQMIDYLALVGDSSDNIPGVKGVGPKSACKLLDSFGDLKSIYENIETMKPPGLKAKLEASREMAYLSKELVTIKTDVPLNVELSDLKLEGLKKDELLPLLKELNFDSFEKKLNATSSKKKTTQKKTKSSNSKQKNQIKMSSPEDLKTQIEPYSEVIVLEAQEKWGVVFKNTIYELETEKLTQYGKVLGSKILKWRGFNLKKFWHQIDMDSYPTPQEDIMLSAYILKAGSIKSIESLMKDYLEVEIEEEDFGLQEYLSYFLQLSEHFTKELSALEGVSILNDLELPLLPVLYSMERQGIGLNVELLKEQQKSLEIDIEKIVKSVHEISGEEFNLASPKQLSKILFEKLSLPVIKKTKTGYSTDNSVLEKLSDQHEICRLIIEFRELSKLLSTYVKALPELLNEKTKRLHTRFQQAVTTTGRLSSKDPNLQNIPIRTERGREVRKAFVAKPGSQLLSIDYSQIELRILAHMSQDESMIDAFNKDIDIHQATASLVFAETLDNVTSEMRRKAKAVNFGIAYGQGVFGLAESLGISRGESKEIIENYFERFPAIQKYMADVVEDAREKGYVETLLGRRRYLPELKSSSVRLQKFGERAAINAPIQGTASDIVKKAMIEIFDEVSAQILLQVHDELILEVEDDELDEVKETVTEIMEEVVKMRVPLKVNIAVGKNWEEAHS